MEERRHVIFITDGDTAARKAVEEVSREIGASCISASAGNPTKLTGEQIVSLILQTREEPVLVMFDDSGSRAEGVGEEAMRFVFMHPQIHVLGALAVASSTHSSEWTHVDISIDRYGELTEFGVDKEGVRDLEIGRLNGDTVHILDELNLPIVVGIGDIGKMAGLDSVSRGSPTTKKAIELIIERSGFS